MHVYFVRHGETDLNRAHKHQSPSTPLSPKGREDILTTAESLRAVNPSLIVSSEYTRALESARIIGSCTGLVPVTNGLFYEIERPSKFFNTSIFSIKTAWYVILSVCMRNNATWRYEDAENATDVSTRARKALHYLESLSGTHESVVVVSHSVFINIMISYLCTTKMLDIRNLARTFFQVDHMKNGGIIHVEYTQNAGMNTCTWHIVHETREN
jgi:broad specificity phosphatase PhoE